jgi:riboflavin kinase / FMN adenylyltransferase
VGEAAPSGTLPGVDVVSGLGALPIDAGPTAVTIGFFDGVHRGHQAVLRRTVEVAGERGIKPVAVTFDRHPREVLTPGKEPPLLTTLERKAELIAGLGIDALVVLEFTHELSTWSPVQFVDRVLAAGLHAAHAVVGSNFTFGHKAEGTLPMLAELGSERRFTVEGMSLHQVDGRPVSSSSIREALAAGHLEWPAEALGRRFALDGTVVRGAGRGAALGFPTANLEVPSRMLIPAEGVYAGKAYLPEGEHVAAINVGTNPTFGDEPLHVEAFLLDFDGGLLGRPISLEFWERLRDEERFESPEALSRQIAEDVDRTLAVVTPDRVR